MRGECAMLTRFGSPQLSKVSKRNKPLTESSTNRMKTRRWD